MSGSDQEDQERLLSAALDDPANADLQAWQAATLSTRPELRKLIRDWLRLEQALRAPPPALARIDWDRFTAAIHAGVSVAERDPIVKLDRALRRLGQLEAQVDWGRFADRVASLCRAEAPASRQRYRRPAALLAGLVGAAAVLVLALWLPGAAVQSRPLLDVAIRMDDEGITEVRFAGLSDTIQPDSSPAPIAQVLYLQIDRRWPNPQTEDRGYY